MSPSFWQIAIVAVIVVLLFGAGKIPRLMNDMGKGINAFKKGLKESEAPEEEDAKLDSEKQGEGKQA